jgi:hypothetical protein
MTRFRPLKRGVSHLFPKSLYKGAVILGGTLKTSKTLAPVP